MSFKKYFLLLIISILSLHSCHLIRSVLFLRPDHHDNRKFPKNQIAEANEIYNWEYTDQQLDPKTVQVQYKDGSKSNLEKLLEKTFTNGFLIIKEGKIYYENYYHNYSVERTHGSFSVSKGMLSTMLGIALEEGLIQSLDDPITKYLPELKGNDLQFEAINIENLLDMNSGIKVRKGDANLMGDLARTYYGNNFTRFLKTIEIDTLPGVKHLYNQTDAQILSLILTRVTNKNLSEYFQEKVWSKIGGNAAYWNTYKKDKLEKGFCCFNARIQDYAKFGQLYLQKGKWNDVQVVPEAWVEYTTNKVVNKESKWHFSFHKYWFPANDGKSDYTAQGYNRQFIYVNPDKDLVILRFGQKEKTKVDWEKALREIANQL